MIGGSDGTKRHSRCGKEALGGISKKREKQNKRTRKMEVAFGKGFGEHHREHGRHGNAGANNLLH